MKLFEIVNRICIKLFLSYSGGDYFECEIEKYKFSFFIKDKQIYKMNVFYYNSKTYKYNCEPFPDELLTAIKMLTKDILNN